MPLHLLQQRLLGPLHTLVIQLSLTLLWLLEHKKILSSTSLLILSANLELCYFPYGSAPLPLHSYRLGLLLKKDSGSRLQLSF